MQERSAGDNPNQPTNITHPTEHNGKLVEEPHEKEEAKGEQKQNQTDTTGNTTQISGQTLTKETKKENKVEK
jgi:hypothetical protein